MVLAVTFSSHSGRPDCRVGNVGAGGLSAPLGLELRCLSLGIVSFQHSAGFNNHN